jgi:hypothetical protein
MRALIFTFATAALICICALATSAAMAGPSRPAPTTLRIAMHDPGCHWFMLGHRFTKSATVRGSVRLVNDDIAALKVASRHGVRRIAVGTALVVARGSYVIYMVGQAADDNYLRLTVR